MPYEPALLALYTPDPNHYLASYSGFEPQASREYQTIVLTVQVQAPAAPGAHLFQMALGGGGLSYTPQLGLVGFQTPGGSVVRSLQVGTPSTSTPFTVITTVNGVTPSTVHDVECADVDRDGRDDLVLLGPTGFMVRRSIPGGFATSAAVFAAGSRDCALADFDGDGFTDIALSNGTVMFGNGGSLWTPVVAAAHGMPAAGVAAGDVDGDGLADVVFADQLKTVVARGQANRTFVRWSQGLPTTAASPVAGEPQLVDLDADGRAELIVSVPELTTVTPRVYRSTVAGAWSLVGTLPANRRVLAIDVDGNGTKELMPSQGWQLFAYTPQGLIQAGATPVSRFAKAVALDFDRDGRPDIALGNGFPFTWPPSMQLWRNTGSGFAAVQLPGAPAAGFQVLNNFTQLVAADFDGDTFPDLTAAHDTVLVAWRNAQLGVAGYGEPCAAPGSAPPELSVQGSIAPGQAGALVLANALPSGMTAFWLGDSRTLWNGLPLLPLDLGIFGAPGCTLLAEPAAIHCAVANGAGIASLPFTVPLVAPGAAVAFFVQGAVHVPAANALDGVFSRGLVLKIQ